MAYTVTQGSHPDFYILTYSGNLEYDEMFIADDLHLNEGRPIYILADTSQLNNTLPDHFLEGITKSFVKHPNIAYIASFIPSTVLRIAGNMVVKITRQQNKITVFQTYDEAYQMIEQIIREKEASTKTS